MNGAKPKHGDLMVIRVMREQRWAYERRLEHLSYHAMRLRISRPEEEGGLGYDLSEQTLKGLVSGYRDRMQGVEAMAVEEHRERELQDLEMLTRLGMAAAAKAAAEGALDEKAANLVLRASAERRKLLGLDAPAQTGLTATSDVAVRAELDAMLARLGKKPLKHKKKGARP